MATLSLYLKDGELPSPRRILFLGDSITDDGRYIAYIDAYFRRYAPEARFEFIAMGVSSETVSGLSEPDHPFPRPCVFDRLDAALAEVRPDWVVCMYGMNDGIYYPFGEDRFDAYRQGILKLIERIAASGAETLLLTPPIFDGATLAEGMLQPEGEASYSYLRPYEAYNSVLRRYADWLLSLAGSPGVRGVVDIHGPLMAFVDAKRLGDPAYAYGDGIHPGSDGHWIIARTVLNRVFAVTLTDMPPDIGESEAAVAGTGAGIGFGLLVQERQHMLAAAWKEHVGHGNPNKADAMPLAEAVSRASATDRQLDVLALESERARPYAERSEPLPGGQRLTTFMLDGREGVVIAPAAPKDGQPWIWRAEFLHAFDAADRLLVEQGWHLAYYRISDLYGCPGAVRRMRRFHGHIVHRFGLAPRAALFGFSRGGLYSLAYAAAYPGLVSALYLDAPVVQTASWPGGMGSGPGSAVEWQDCLAVYGMDEEGAALADQERLDAAERIAAAGVPLLLVAGDADKPVPYGENGARLVERYRKAGGDVTVILKPGVGHHPHSLDDPLPIAKFIRMHA